MTSISRPSSLVAAGFVVLLPACALAAREWGEGSIAVELRWGPEGSSEAPVTGETDALGRDALCPAEPEDPRLGRALATPAGDGWDVWVYFDVPITTSFGSCPIDAIIGRVGVHLDADGATPEEVHLVELGLVPREDVSTRGAIGASSERTASATDPGRGEWYSPWVRFDGTHCAPAEQSASVRVGWALEESCRVRAEDPSTP